MLQTKGIVYLCDVFVVYRLGYLRINSVPFNRIRMGASLRECIVVFKVYVEELKLILEIAINVFVCNLFAYCGTRRQSSSLSVG